MGWGNDVNENYQTNHWQIVSSDSSLKRVCDSEQVLENEKKDEKECWRSHKVKISFNEAKMPFIIFSRFKTIFQGKL